MELDLNTVVPCCSGPKRPQDRIPVSDMKTDFETCLGAKVVTERLQHLTNGAGKMCNLLFTFCFQKSYTFLKGICFAMCFSKVSRVSNCPLSVTTPQSPSSSIKKSTRWVMAPWSSLPSPAAPTPATRLSCSEPVCIRLFCPVTRFCTHYTVMRSNADERCSFRTPG